jgi:hypothetical protein
LGVAFQARAQIRRPLGSHVEVTVSVVDTGGRILGVARTPDAPVFGTDVSLQKARSAMFFSNPAAPGDLSRAPAPPSAFGYAPGSYVPDIRNFFGSDVLDGGTAFSNRSIGNIARPFFPDGQNGRYNGPLSLPFEIWSPFQTGLQLDLVCPNLAASRRLRDRGGQPTRPRAGANLAAPRQRAPDRPGRLAARPRQHAGGRDRRLGRRPSDQDDRVRSLAPTGRGRRCGTRGGNAPSRSRGPRDPDGVNLRYVHCPFRPA